MSHTPQAGAVDLCSAFLKLPAGTTDERQVLGLPADEALTREQVLGALRDRLKQVSEHPMAASPEAAEVRMLLHACVARLLLGPNAKALQDSAAQVLSGGHSDASGHREVSRFEELALLTLAQHGGWTKQAVHHLQLVALSAGIPADQVAQAMTDLAGQAWAGGGAAPSTHEHSLVTRSTVTGPRVALFQTDSVKKRASVSTARASTTSRKREMTDEEREAKMQAAFAELHAHSQEDPARRMIRNALIGGGVGILCLVVVAIGLRFMFKSGGGSLGNGPAKGGNSVSSLPAGSNATAGNGGSGASVTSPTSGNSEQNIGTNAGGDISAREQKAGAKDDAKASSTGERPARELISILRRSAAEADRDGAADEFVGAMQELSIAWPQGSAGDVIAAADATAELAYRAAGRGDALSPIVRYLNGELSLMTEAVDGSAWDAQRIARSAFACGVASRLLRERDLPTGIRLPLRRALSDALGGSMSSEQSTVQQTITASLDHMATLMTVRRSSINQQDAPALAIAATRSFAAWGAWAKASRATAGGGDESEQLILLALDRVMTKGREPSEDPAVARAIESLGGELSLVKDSPARSAILRWMVASDVSAVDLHLLTTVLVQRPESGLELTATLSGAATENDRQLLRERYANLWQVTEGTVQDALMAKWRQRFTELTGVPIGTSLQERVAYALAMSSMNTAAVEAMRGDVAAFGTLLDAAQKPLHGWASKYKNSDSVSSTTWGVEYLAAGNDIFKRRGILLAVNGVPSPMEARILVEEATRAGSPEIRREARNVIVRSLDTATTVRAFLDYSAFIPATRDNSRLLEAAARATLPQPRSSTWRVEVRRALLRRLLEELSPNDNSSVDLAADRLLLDYRERTSGLASPKGEEREGEGLVGAKDDPMDAEKAAKADEPRPETLPILAVVPRELLGAMRSYATELAAQAQKGWLADPAFSSVQGVVSTRDARLTEAQSDLQRAVIELNAMVELQSRIVAFNNRSATDQVLAVRGAWRRDASGSFHVIEQIAAGELAQARLWMIRFGGQLDSRTPGGMLLETPAVPGASSGGASGVSGATQGTPAGS